MHSKEFIPSDSLRFLSIMLITNPSLPIPPPSKTSISTLFKIPSLFPPSVPSTALNRFSNIILFLNLFFFLLYLLTVSKKIFSVPYKLTSLVRFDLTFMGGTNESGVDGDGGKREGHDPFHRLFCFTEWHTWILPTM